MMRLLIPLTVITWVIADPVNNQYCKVLTGMDDSLCVDGRCLGNGIPKLRHPCTDDIIDQVSRVYSEQSRNWRAALSLLERVRNFRADLSPAVFFPETFHEYLFAPYEDLLDDIMSLNPNWFNKRREIILSLYLNSRFHSRWSRKY